MNAFPEKQLPRVVVIGGGFGGAQTARALRHVPVEVILIDRANHTLFQPLLYQVATAILAPAEIATPIRQLVRGQPNTTVVMAEVTGVHTVKRQVFVNCLGKQNDPLDYDYLVLATGATHNYFGHEEFADYAPGLKKLTDADSIRDRVLRAFELAEETEDPEEHQDLLTFLLVGGGPTGVELAGSISELRRFTLKSDFRRVNPSKARIIIVEGGKRLLSGFHESLAAAAQKRLEKLGVEVRVGSTITQVDAKGVMIGDERIASRTVIWTAGVKPSPAAKWLGAPADHAGRVEVRPDCSVPGLDGVFVIGDTAVFKEKGKPLPGVAQVAMQQGKYVASVIKARLADTPAPGPFSYFDKGNMAVVGRNFAILEVGSIRMAGFFAWLGWAMVHIVYLAATGNRLRVITQWFWSYLTRQRGSRLILGPGGKSPLFDRA